MASSQDRSSKLDFYDIDRRAGKLRRTDDWGTTADKLQLSEWLFYVTSQQLMVETDERRRLTLLEYRILLLLALTPCRVVTNEQVLDAVSGCGWEWLDRGTDDLISSLRQKIDRDLA